MGRIAEKLPAAGESKRAILESYTKEHSAEYQAQALIDLARRMRQNNPVVEDAEKIKEIVIHTSHHTHNVIGSGANDPQKYDPKASRETLDHSIPYIFTVALQDGSWHHEHSYHPDRANRPNTVALWQRVVTERALITLKNQGTLQSEVSGMQTRSRLYELLDYEKYQDFDNSVFNFTLNKDQ